MIEWTGPKRQPCPQCGRGPKDRTLGVTVDDDGSGVSHCFRCGYVETDRAVRHQGNAPAKPQGQRQHETLSPLGRALWDSCRSLGGEGQAYLRARCCVIPPADGDLRWHPALKHPLSGVVGPALVALVTDALTGKPLTLHRTWIQANGEKAPVDPPRMLLGGHRKAGGVVRLWSDDAVTGALGVAEGIETALSVAHAYRPVWATVDAGNLAALPVLTGVEALVIGADHDEAGIAAAAACARRWRAAHVDVRTVLPPVPGWDFNDQARAP